MSIAKFVASMWGREQPNRPMISTFDELITDQWIDAVLKDGRWHEEHGSDIGRWVDDLIDGQFAPAFVLPDEMANMEPHTLYEEPSFRATFKNWLAVRFNHVVKELQETDLTTIGRVLRVDKEWLVGLAEGTSTLGVFYGSLPLDDGDFWADKDMPVSIYVEITPSPDDIDWQATIYARMDYQWGDDEREIRLKTNRDVLVTALMVDGAETKISPALRASTGTRWPRPEPSTIKFGV